jgi:hypothetical protein
LPSFLLSFLGEFNNMAGQDWSITIVPSEDCAAFTPQNGKPGEPQAAENSDLISWNNRTGQKHQPWQSTSDYQPLSQQQAGPGTPGYLSDPIEPWESSTPAYLCTAPDQGSTTIYYICKVHPKEHGTIVVSAVPEIAS